MNPTLTKFLTSRKFWAFIAACALLAAGSISEETWKWIAGAYLVGQGIADHGEQGVKT